jgi:hypothetical protein
LWKGSRQEILDQVAQLASEYLVDEGSFTGIASGIFLSELAMLSEFAEAVIKPLNQD